jgi:hypothetical protein
MAVIGHSPGRPECGAQVEMSRCNGTLRVEVLDDRPNSAICERLYLSPKTVETHVGSIFTKLGLLPAADDHRRVLAVLTYIRSA